MLPTPSAYKSPTLLLDVSLFSPPSAEISQVWPRLLKSTGGHGHYLNLTCDIVLNNMRQGLKIFRDMRHRLFLNLTCGIWESKRHRHRHYYLLKLTCDIRGPPLGPQISEPLIGIRFPLSLLYASGPGAAFQTGPAQATGICIIYYCQSSGLLSSTPLLSLEERGHCH